MKFFLVCLAAVLLTIASLTMISNANLLTRASRNCDTITINAEYNPALQILTATQTVKYKNRTGTALDSIKFHIYSNAYRDGALYSPIASTEVAEAYPNGKSFGNISVGDIKVRGESVGVFIEGDDENVLSIPVKKTLEPNKTITIDMLYTVKLANIKHRLGYTDSAVNLGNFYPVPCIFENGKWQTYPYSYNGDPFYNALHNFNVNLKCDRNFKVASSGTLIKEVPNGNTMTVHSYKSKAIRDFAMVLSKGFKTLTGMVNKVAVSYYYLDDDNPAESLKCAQDSLKTFSRLFTKYPYMQLSVVQTDFLHGGMEYGELVYISTDVLTDPKNSPRNRDMHNQVIIHEIAHQWWYGVTGNNQTHTAWIDEGLAEYSTLLFYDHNPEYLMDKKQLISNARDNYSFYVKLINTLGAEVDPEMNKDLNSFKTSYEYVYMTYVRGMLLFADLESMLGQVKLTKALKEFARQTSFKFATQDKLITTLEKSTNTKLKLFFNTFLSGVS